jgi:acyl-CoA synthetase (AMP-forming)/AMP-acid ligase II
VRFGHPVLIFCTAKSLENVLELKNYFPVDIILYDTETVDDVEYFDKLVEAGTFDPGFCPTKLDPKEDVALILTSSGTTGFPKSVQLTHASLRVTMLYGGDRYFLDVNENERILAFLPFFHIFGIGLTLAGILYGAKLVILEKFVPDRFLSLIQKHRITKLYAVPPILLFLVKSPLVQKYDLSSITDVLCGAATVTKETEDLVEAQLNIHCVRQIYGMTEVSGGATVIPKNSKKPGSSGQVVTGHQIKICDPEIGKALGVNEVGELRIKGDGVMKGYLGKEMSLIQKHRITKLFAVPPVLLFLVKSPLVQKYDLSSITDVLCGAAAVTKETEDLVEAQLKISCVRQIYGMTEVCGAATVIPKNTKKHGSSGQVIMGHQIKICDPETGKALGINEVGELRIKGDGVMKGYLGQEKETEEAFDEEGYFKSGDLGYYDDEGFFFIVDRLKEIIKYKGFQVSTIYCCRKNSVLLYLGFTS